MKPKHIRFIIEFAAWIIFIGFPLIVFPSFEPFLESGKLNLALSGIILTHLLLIVFYYFNFYYALPKFYFTKKYSAYILILVCCLLAIIFVMMSNKNFNPLPTETFRYSGLAFIFSIFVRFMMIFLFSLGFASFLRLKQSEQEKLKSELSYLKAQINPHFLFNTLNSIYALTVKKSDHAPESVTRLAAMMRYVITEAANDYVSLEKELNYISSYVDLEKLRLTSKTKLNYAVTGDTSSDKIAPLIFVPLIENTFKHGVSTSENSEIDIKINIQSHKLELYIFNTKVRSDKNINNGLGLENVKKRLNLLYSGKHKLEIKNNQGNFIVTLQMTLND